MVNRLRAAIILLVLLTPFPTLPPQPQTDANFIYLPMAESNFPLVNVVEMGVVDWPQTYSKLCKYGYITSNTESTVYSVDLEMPVVSIQCSLSPPYTCLEYPYTAHFHPALIATMPDQKNFFSYCDLYVLDPGTLGNVRVTSHSLTSLDGKVAYPLTIAEWTKVDTDLQDSVYGVVRNGTEYPLSGARVIGIPGLCNTRDAELDSTVLQPGEETNFIFPDYNCLWPSPNGPLPEMVELSAQGYYEPQK